MKEEILERVRKRLSDDESFKVTLVQEYIETVIDRLCIRLNTAELPECFQSIAVDAVIKMHRRAFYEGILSESDGGVSVSFADDILSEYDEEITEYNRRSKKKVHFY